MRRQRGQHPLDAFVAHRPEDQHPPAVPAEGTQVVGQPLGAVGIVGGVEEHAWTSALSRQPLEPARPADRGDALTDPHGVERSQFLAREEPFRPPDRERQIVELVAPREREPEIVVSGFGRKEPTRRSGTQDREVGLGFDGQVPRTGAPLPGALVEHRGGLRLLRGDQQFSPGTGHRPFFAGDLGDGPAQIALVIERDAGHEAERSVGRGSGVPASAHPHLEDRGVEPVPGERQESGPGDRFEERWLLVRQQAAGSRRDRPHQVGELLIRKLPAVHQDALVDGYEMRGGETSHPESVGAQDRVQNGDRGPLPVRPRHHHGREPAFGVAERLGEQPDVPGAYLDVELFAFP